MKKTALHIVILLFCGNLVFAQIGLNTDGSPPDPSSILDIKFTDKGVLIPRITSTMRIAIENPAPGLLVFQTNEPEGFWFYNGASWSKVISTRGSFNPNYLPKYTIKDTLAGSILYDYNNGIGAGTTSTRNKHLSFPVGSGISWGNQYSRIYDNIHLHFITDDSLFFDDNYNGTRMFINTNTGQVGIGTTYPDRTLDVSGVVRSQTTSGSANAAGQFQSIVAGTAQGQHAVYSFYPTFQNTADNDPRRAADILAGYNGGAWSKEYLSFHVGNNGNDNDAQNLTSEKMRITGNGNIGIGTTSPNASALLDVTSISRGFLLPHMTSEKIMEIASPANGLMVFCTTNNTFYSYNSSTSTWREVSGGASILIPGTCGGSFTVSHIEGNIAPVNKTVTYGTVTNVPGEPEKCWITRNLGASQQASAVNDASEASAGWYWQFNRAQGYKHDGTTRTPNTTWITSIDENSDWTEGNDPCNLLLASGWRIPSVTEWTNVNDGGNWTDWYGPWNSLLKMHAAGRIAADGNLYNRGTSGDYFSNAQQGNQTAKLMYFDDGSCGTQLVSSKAIAHTLRCIRCVNPS
jgi:hypothetical protein